MARDWDAERSPFAARGFLLVLEDTLNVVMEAPERSTIRSFGCRHYVFPSRYPFTLVYRLVPHVEMVAVAHQRRRPEYWRDR
jgi:hypothetical protein